jgi:hypothetical protein
MKVAIFSTHILWSQHYETELEIMQNHLDEGDEVIQIVCNRSLGICDTNLEHGLSKCLACTSKRNFGKSLLKGNVTELDLLMGADREMTQELAGIRTDFSTLEALQEYQIDNFPIGYAVGSTLVSLVRNSALNLSENKDQIVKLLKYALLTYRAALRFLEKERPDRVYVFNGRFPYPRAVLSACEYLGIDCYIHERGYNYFHYELYKNRLPQDLVFIQELIEQAWLKAEEPIRTERGKQFFSDRRTGKEQGWVSFVKGQALGELPAGWDPEKHNIVIFNSSEDEFVSCTADWKNKLYMSQYEAIRRIAADLADDPDIRIYLRAHPNLAKASDNEKAELLSLSKEELIFIPPESKISSYAMLDHASVVLTFNSTVGIEATFWDKPSVLAGPSLYDRLGSNYLPTSHQEVLQLLRSRDLEPMPKSGAIKYGYFFNSFGIPFRHFEPDGFANGKYKGIDVVPFMKNMAGTFEFKVLSNNALKPVHRFLYRLHERKKVKI